MQVQLISAKSRNMVLFFLLFFVTRSCNLETDCSLNGKCQKGNCICRSPWTGTNCARMLFVPQDPDYLPAYGFKPRITSWGGGVFKGDDGLFHLFVSEIVDGLGLHFWTNSSQIIHAVSDDIMGIFKKIDISLPVFAHNAAPMRGVKIENGSAPWYLFHIGNGVTIHMSSSPNGPWIPLPAIQGATHCNNPAPVQHPNGTLYCLCGSRSLFATEDPTNGTNWRHITDLKPPPNTTNWGPSKYLKVEDAYVYLDSEQNFHALFHRYDYRDGCPANPNQTVPVLVSGHAYSTNGHDWEFNDEPPYPNWVDFKDGTRKYFATLERPHLVFNEHGQLTHLINGVSDVWPCEGCEARP